MWKYKYKYNLLHMGINISMTLIFQNVMSKLVQTMEYVNTSVLPWWFIDTNNAATKTIYLS
jgi:hypothetical protein